MTKRMHFGIIVSFALMLSSASAAQLPKACGGFIFADCAGGQFCQAPVGQCFIPAGGGTCSRILAQCTNVNQPVCGCDGKTYRNNCLRLQAKVSMAHAGRCV